MEQETRLDKSVKDARDYGKDWAKLFKGYTPEEEEDMIRNRMYGFPLRGPMAFGGLGSPGSVGYGGPSGVPGMGRYAPSALLPPSAYGSSGNVAPASYGVPGRGIDSMIPYGASGAGPRGGLSISYTASDGTVYNIGASYNIGSRDSVVDGLMKYVTALVKSDSGKGNYSKGGSKGG